jgi:histone-arginine methyltransferase CARM1
MNRQSETKEAKQADSLTENPNSHYFYYYGKLREQQNMLQDNVRMNSYYAAIAKNPEDFKDKVVLDVGTGTGVLAMFAAAAGARKVYAVEASRAADVARQLIQANGLSHIIEVINARLEDVVLPEAVDVIISEPMGVSLVHERMLESFVLARKFLRPGGKMVPSTGVIHSALFSDSQLFSLQTGKSLFWSQTSFYDINWTGLRQRALEEHFSQPVVGIFQPGCVCSGRMFTNYHNIQTLFRIRRACHEHAHL